MLKLVKNFLANPMVSFIFFYVERFRRGKGAKGAPEFCSQSQKACHTDVTLCLIASHMKNILLSSHCKIHIVSSAILQLRCKKFGLVLSIFSLKKIFLYHPYKIVNRIRALSIRFCLFFWTHAAQTNITSKRRQLESCGWAYSNADGQSFIFVF